MGKTLEGEEPPFGWGSFPLQTSLISPNFPARQPPGWGQKLFSLFGRRLPYREVFGGLGGAGAIKECGFAPDLWAGRVGNVCLARVEIDPPSSVAYATASPQGEAFCTLCEHGKQR